MQAQHPQSQEEWTKALGKTFSFMGPGVSCSFLRGTGWLPGAHSDDCPVVAKVKKAKAPWTRVK